MNRSLFVILILFPQFIFSQNEDPYSNSKIGVNYINTSEEGGLENFWDAQNGFGVFFQTPFYAGDILLGLNHIPCEGMKEKYPNFKSNYIYLGWIGKVKLPLNSALGAGLKFGTFMMSFESDTLSSFSKTESEFAVGPFAQFSINIFKWLMLDLSGEYTVVLTNREMKLVNFSAGLSYSFSTPAWLRKIFE